VLTSGLTIIAPPGSLAETIGRMVEAGNDFAIPVAIVDAMPSARAAPLAGLSDADFEAGCIAPLADLAAVIAGFVAGSSPRRSGRIERRPGRLGRGGSCGCLCGRGDRADALGRARICGRRGEPQHDRLALRRSGRLCRGAAAVAAGLLASGAVSGQVIMCDGGANSENARRPPAGRGTLPVAARISRQETAMSQPTVKSALRTFEVLELFAERRVPLRLQDIHTALGYPQSSTTALLKSMVCAAISITIATIAPICRPPASACSATGCRTSSRRPAATANWSRNCSAAPMKPRRSSPVTICSCNISFCSPEPRIPDGPAGRRDAQAGRQLRRALADGAHGRARDRQAGALFQRLQQRRWVRVSFTEIIAKVEQVRPAGLCLCPEPADACVSSITMALEADLYGVPLVLGVGGMAGPDRRSQG
jgi:hypothetical protein